MYTNPLVDIPTAVLSPLGGLRHALVCLEVPIQMTRLLFFPFFCREESTPTRPTSVRSCFIEIGDQPMPWSTLYVSQRYWENTIGRSGTYILMDAVFICTSIVISEGTCTGGVCWTCPGTISGNAEAKFGVGAADGGAEPPGKIPRALKAVIRGFSDEVAAGCGVLFPVGIWGNMLGTWGGGVGCWRAAVALRSPASVPGFKSC